MRDGRRFEAEANERSAEQARTLTTWASISNTGTAHIGVTNHGDKPFMAVEVRALVMQGPEHRDAARRDQLPRWPLLPAGETIQGMVQTDAQPIDGNRSNFPEVTLIVDYVDAAGVRWRRWSNVDPERAPSQPRTSVRPLGVEWPD